MDKTPVINLLSQLVKIPSASSEDNTPIIEFLADLFKDEEKTIQDWVRHDGVKGKNLVVRIPGRNSDKSLVFVCHMDTVPSSSEWKTDPYTLTELGGKLYGLGACDTKGGTASLIHAVNGRVENLPCDVFLVFSGDEEAGSAGVIALKEKMSFKNPQFVFIEPTDNKVLISQRSVLQVDVVTHGQAKHGSYATPEENETNNAIFKMGKAIVKLTQDAEEIAREKDLLLGSNTQNFGKITGGTARNVIADKCVLEFDRRLLPQRNMDEEIKRIETLLKVEDPGIEVIPTVSHPSFSTPENRPIVQAAQDAMKKGGRNEGVGGFQAWSEAGLFAKDGDVIILGPGSIQQAHVANEFVEAKDIEDYILIFQHLIAGV